MRTAAGRMQTVGAGMLVLAVTVAAPALSIAQDPEAPVEPAPPAPAPPSEPDPPAPGEAAPADQAAAEQVTGQAAAIAAAPDPQPEARAKTKAKAKASASRTVSVGDNFYSPATVSIALGDTITWKNNGAAPHSATAEDGSFDTGVFNGGQSRSETFTSAGTIPYFCTVHGQVQSGTIKVLAASGGGGGGGGSASTGNSEAAAVASPGAGGSGSSLPATGLAAIGLVASGLVLVGGGAALRRFEPEA